MRFLIDTHAFLWYMAGDPRLSTNARTLMDDESNERLLSVAVPWEIAIKNSLGKLDLDEPFESLIPRLIRTNDLVLLPIHVEHTAAVAILSYPPGGHRDPFDRLMIAQSQVEDIPIVSIDGSFDEYDVERVW